MTTCDWPGCVKPKGGKGHLCWMHQDRKRRGKDMDAPEHDPAMPWKRLAAAAERHTKAMREGWSDRAVRSAEEQLKRAAEGYRRQCKKARGKRPARAAETSPAERIAA